MSPVSQRAPTGTTLGLQLAERVFINQGCTFLDYAGIRLGHGVMVGHKLGT